jgi:phosphoglycolate phosphatase-like HAD superfamily hydrolase
MKNKSAIVFDLDETLISTSFRQYKVVSEFLRNQLSVEEIISFDDYLQKRKLHRLSNWEIVRLFLNNDRYKTEYFSYVSSVIETPFYLSYDKLIVSLDAMEHFNKHFGLHLILVSLRNNIENSRSQLMNLGLFQFFKEIYFVPHSFDNPKTKILESLKSTYDLVGFVGDSEIDSKAADDSSVNFFNVETGIYPNQSTHKKFIDVNFFFKKIISDGKI